MMPLLVGPVVAWYLARKAKGDVDKWATPTAGLSGVFFLSLFYTQIIGIIKESGLNLPAKTATKWEWTSKTLNLFSLLRPDCADFTSFITGFVGKMLVPVYAAFIFLVTYFVSQVLPKKLKMNRDQTQHSYGSMFNTFYISVASQSMSLFQCIQHPTGEYSLEFARHFFCYKGDWLSLLVVSIVSILVFCVGSLVVFAYIVWNAPVYFDQQWFRMRWKFLFMKWRPGSYRMSLIILLKGLWVCAGRVFFEAGDARLMWLNTCLLSYLFFVSFTMPWRVWTLCILDVLTHAMLTYVVDVTSLTAILTGGASADIGRILATISMIFYAVPLVIMIWHLYRRCTFKGFNWDPFVDKMCTLFGQAARHPETIEKMMTSLAWSEAMAMAKVLNILKMECPLYAGRTSVTADENANRRMSNMMVKALSSTGGKGAKDAGAMLAVSSMGRRLVATDCNDKDANKQETGA